MISDMSWLISAWKAKVSTSSSAILSVLVLGSYGRDCEARAKAVRDGNLESGRKAETRADALVPVVGRSALVLRKPFLGPGSFFLSW